MKVKEFRAHHFELTSLCLEGKITNQSLKPLPDIAASQSIPFLILRPIQSCQELQRRNNNDNKEGKLVFRDLASKQGQKFFWERFSSFVKTPKNTWRQPHEVRASALKRTIFAIERLYTCLLNQCEDFPSPVFISLAMPNGNSSKHRLIFACKKDQAFLSPPPFTNQQISIYEMS